MGWNARGFASTNRFIILLAALLLLPVLPAAGADRRGLTIGISQFPSTFHPAIENMSAKNYVLGMTYRRLTLFDPDWHIVCTLCTELPTVENGRIVPERRPDGSLGQAVTFTLPEGVRWGDGTPLTSRDVLFSWQVGRHPTNGYYNQRVFAQDVVDVTVVDDRTFTLHRARSHCTLEELNEFFILPEHIERPVFEANPDEYRRTTRYETAPLTPGLWMGPYLPARMERGSHILLERNPHWHGAAPWFERITVKAIENTVSLEAALMSGDVDMVPGEIGSLAVEQVMGLERRLRGRINTLYKPALVYEHVDLNLDNPILADRRVRQALLKALDRDAIVQNIFAGKYLVAHQQVSPRDPAHAPGYLVHPHDPAAAAALLEAAGWMPGPDGIRVNADGQRLTLDFTTTGGNRGRELVQQAMQQQWRQVGVEVRIRNEPPRVMFGQTARERRFTGAMMYAWTNWPGQVPRTTLHSAMIPTAENGFAGQNYPGFRNAGMDRVLDGLETTCEAGPRQRLWAEQQRLYTEELPALPLFYRSDLFVLPTWLDGLRPTGHSYASTNWVEQWRAQ